MDNSWKRESILVVDTVGGFYTCGAVTGGAWHCTNKLKRFCRAEVIDQNVCRESCGVPAKNLAMNAQFYVHWAYFFSFPATYHY